MDTTIIYYSDGCVPDDISRIVKHYLLKSGLPIISVTQEPMDFGQNYCIGKIGRSYESIQSQILAGAWLAKTKYVALCEHDTIYPEGYFDYTPPDDSVFVYNKNRTFVIAKKGPQYGTFIIHKDSHPNADQLICDRDNLIGATQVRRELLTRVSNKDLPTGWMEPGFAFPKETFTWRTTKIPAIDILHNDNFTCRYGQYAPDELSTYLKGWGTWDDVLRSA